MRIARIGGFTLLELLLVLLLIGLVYGLAGQMISDGPTTLEAKSASRQLAAGLRKARSIAATERREAVLILDVEEKQFSVTGDTKAYRLPNKLGVSLFTADSELLQDRKAAIRFYPDGSSTGGRISISAGESRLLVDVDWLTGRVAIL